MTTLEIINTIEKTYQSIDLVYERMFAHFANLSGFGFQTVTLKQGSQIIRARYTDKLTSFINLSDISYPQRKHVKFFSRLNRPSQNLFYASASEKACLTEMLPFWIDEFNVADIIMVTLGKWTVRNDLKLLVIPDTDNLNELNRSVLKQLQPSEIEFWNYISNKFKTSTKQDKNIYEFTSAFGNALWLNSKNQNINASGFIYSSVQSPDNVNIALCTKTIDSEKLVPSEVVETHFQKIGFSDKGLPTYKEIGDRKSGFIDLKKALIDWN